MLPGCSQQETCLGRKCPALKVQHLGWSSQWFLSCFPRLLAWLICEWPSSKENVVLFLWDTQQARVFSGSDNPAFLVCPCITVWSNNCLPAVLWYCCCILIPAHQHHVPARKCAQPLQFSSKWMPWKHKACPSEALGVPHAASIYLVKNEELRDSTNESWCERSGASMFLLFALFLTQNHLPPGSGKELPLLLTSSSTHLSVSH